MTENYSGFSAWLASFLQKWTTIDGSFWQKMHRKCGNWGEAGSRIGSADYRPIAPLAKPQVVLRWLDEPKDRWSDHLAFPLCPSRMLKKSKRSLFCPTSVHVSPLFAYATRDVVSPKKSFSASC